MESSSVREIVARMEQTPTEELLVIWKKNDGKEWSDDAFEAIRQVLTQRNVELPIQEPKIREDKSQAMPGVIQIVAGIAIGLLAYSRRPDAIPDSLDYWVLKPNVYYAILFVAALCALAGIISIVKWTKTSPVGNVHSGSEGSSLDEIKKAKALFDEGAIDEVEFKKIKQKALER